MPFDGEATLPAILPGREAAETAGPIQGEPTE
jgi:hypothetical protein